MDWPLLGVALHRRQLPGTPTHVLGFACRCDCLAMITEAIPSERDRFEAANVEDEETTVFKLSMPAQLAVLSSGSHPIGAELNASQGLGGPESFPYSKCGVERFVEAIVPVIP